MQSDTTWSISAVRALKCPEKEINSFILWQRFRKKYLKKCWSEIN